MPYENPLGSGYGDVEKEKKNGSKSKETEKDELGTRAPQRAQLVSDLGGGSEGPRCLPRVGR